MSEVAATAIAAGVAVAGWWARWLSGAGAVAAASVGTVTLIAFGLSGGFLLGLFFVSGSVLTYGTGRGRRSTRPRGVGQVAANGFWVVAAAPVVPFDHRLAWAAAVGALAAAQADTWATEIGTRSGRAPRLITTKAEVAPGTSGGVTGPGTAAGWAGAAMMAVAGILVGVPTAPALSGALGGGIGMTADSWLGARLQAKYRCATCNTETEDLEHACPGPLRLVHGRAWCTNDTVNLLGSGTGALTAAAVAWIGRHVTPFAASP